ncbi:hypothetical protein SAMN05444395_11020 [Flavobacterium fryxellicola]|uniref:hypothetical protein n=1 Tax=Flavobacterium fryxellicola TaxID=249352 RepID=UPI000913C4F2|nr:hypothetical protein [Flavobacterium fryxellicola]SHN75972.1 hypothetical protein SAMN05444395_11020 [Flavobacterium fryxellicola]
MEKFKKLIQKANEFHKANLLPPQLITLGDEFHGIARDLDAEIGILIALCN